MPIFPMVNVKIPSTPAKLCRIMRRLLALFEQELQKIWTMLVHHEAAELDPAARPKRCDEERYVSRGTMNREHARYQSKLIRVSIMLIHQGPRTLVMDRMDVCERHQSRPERGRDNLAIIPCMPLTTKPNRPLIFQNLKSSCKMFASWMQITGGFQ